MDSRREFLKKAALLSGAATLPNVIQMSIQKAMAINAAPGSTFYDAEHVVFLMQENRSFDHMFGKMKGVRGFNDPRAFTLPDLNKVWIQKDNDGKAYVPFHVDINKTKITWQGGLPHSWRDQLAARNEGKYDKWVPVKTEMSLAYYDRNDIPFYYAMADAFTICDHNFSSSLTGTTPNRLFFWTGNIRPELNDGSRAVVNNEQAESRNGTYVDWETFPEILEDHNISWKIYQNELWSANLKGDAIDDWLGNYGDNALEYVKRYNVKLSAYFRKNGDKKANLSPAEVTEKYNNLSQREKNLIDKAFASNIHAPFNYLELAPFTFTDDLGKEQTLEIPKNDIFYQFRSDVDQGKLPAVSWLVAPQRFSDHTSSPLYGTWYVSEAIEILTKNPEVWKKTIFVLTYDENDGYFDHIPPYVVPKPGDPESGKVSENIDVRPDYENRKGSPIGLGYRVPMIIASPWSKGGYVNSQVFDHTSCLMFLEKFLSKKTGKKIKSKLISDWRRAICGDLTSAFRPASGVAPAIPPLLKKEMTIVNISNARNKPPRIKPEPLSQSEIDTINLGMNIQEGGIRKACALPYQLMAEGNLSADRSRILLSFESAKGSLKHTAPSGAPFSLYSKKPYKKKAGKTWDYAVSAGDRITDQLKIDDFEDGRYNICISGPNGFYREFNGSKADPLLHIHCHYETRAALGRKPVQNLIFTLENKEHKDLSILINNNVYQSMPPIAANLKAKGKTAVRINLQMTSGWYDIRITLKGDSSFSKQYAGHAENGQDSITDPLMGRVE